MALVVHLLEYRFNLLVLQTKYTEPIVLQRDEHHYTPSKTGRSLRPHMPDMLGTRWKRFAGKC